MANPSDSSVWPDSSVSYLASIIEKTKFHRELHRKLEDLIYDPDVTSDTMEDQMRILISDSGYKQNVRNLIYQEIVKNPNLKYSSPQEKEPVDYIQKYQINWEHRISKSLNDMSNELGIVFSRKRPIDEQIEFEAQWSKFGSEDMDLSRFRPVYSPEDFLEFLINVKSPNTAITSTDKGMSSNRGLIKVPLKVKSFSQFKSEFEELSLNYNHLARYLWFTESLPSIAELLYDNIKVGKIVLEENDPIFAREYCKRGCPVSLRAEMWSLILGIKIGEAPHKFDFFRLKSCVFQHDLLIDKLIFKDLHSTASDDDQYFVFKDLLYQILLAFTRDTSVASHFDMSTANPPEATVKETPIVTYPPNGVIPFHGFSMYVAPLCYIYEDPITLYQIFRELYIRYFCRLHNLSSHPQGVLSLALTFETLLEESEPQLVHHFSEHDIYPLKIAIKWIMKAFSGYLKSAELLLLWDCVLAYNTTEIIVVLAVGILSLRKTILLQAENQATVENALADISAIEVMPVLKGMLKN